MVSPPRLCIFEPGSVVKMRFFLSLLPFLSLAAAAPAVLEGRAATTCGNKFYSAAQVAEAAQQACTRKPYPILFVAVSARIPPVALCFWPSGPRVPRDILRGPLLRGIADSGAWQ